jgi:FkbM family methyltransferase
MDHLDRRRKLIEGRRINLVLDVGANTGQFARSLRTEIGYAGRIVSFEPLTDAFLMLQQNAAADPLWDCVNVALGDIETIGRINISANSHSSSLLEVMERAVQVEPSIAYVGQQEVTVHRLDGLLGTVTDPNDLVYLKIDAQGYETRILNGALKVLDRFELIQLETSLTPVYLNEPLIGDVIKFLDYLDYRIVAIEPGWEDPKTSELLQADLIFARK